MNIERVEARKVTAALYDSSWDYIINAINFFVVEAQLDCDPECERDIKRGTELLAELRELFPEKFPNGGAHV